MRIAFFIRAFPVISETFILNQITGLIDRGHHVDIFPRFSRTLENAHPQIERYRLMDHTYPLNTPGKNRLGRARKALSLLTTWFVTSRPEAWATIFHILSNRRAVPAVPFVGLLEIALRQLQNGPYDVIHCQFGTLGRQFIGLKDIGLLPGKFVTSIRGHDITQQRHTLPGLYDKLFDKCDLFLPVSLDLKERLVTLGCNPSKIEVHHSGIDCSLFRYRTPSIEDNQPVKIISIGRLVEKKGISYGIDAVATLIKRGRKIHYDIIGDGPLCEILATKIRQLGVEEHIKLRGWQDHDAIKTYLAAAHLLMAPSVTASDGDMEGIPNVVKEAMTMGLPVISTFHGGIPELVEDGVSGYLTPERDVAALIDRLSYLMDHSELWEKMGAAGRKKVEQEFNSATINSRLVALYRAPRL